MTPDQAAAEAGAQPLDHRTALVLAALLLLVVAVTFAADVVRDRARVARRRRAWLRDVHERERRLRARDDVLRRAGL